MKSNHKMNTIGFTILELLVSMGLLGIFLAVIGQYFVSSSTITSNIATETMRQQELRIAGAIINDTVQRAIYVFPPCGAYTSTKETANSTVPNPIMPTNSTCGAVTGAIESAVQVTWSQFKLGDSDKTVTGPHNSTIWQVGKANAPILAMITAPRKPTLECAIATKAQSCYQFIAYYAVPRKQLTIGQTTPSGTLNTSTSLENLPDDSRAQNTWVIMEYRKDFVSSTLAKSVSVNGTSISIDVVPWGRVGCQNNTTLPCADYPETDPYTSDTRALPSIKKGETTLTKINAFSARIKTTVDQLIDTTTPANCASGSNCNGQADILIDGIAPYDSSTGKSGFMIDFPVKTTASPNTFNSIDERGVTEVRVRLASGLMSRGVTPAFTSVEFFTSPRNISPQ
jgi:type II secretory pathway pseudopilin PulG